MNYSNDVQPLVSVIIPTFNYARFLPTAIESAVSQTYPNVEILIIDDGSTDNTAAIVKQTPGVKYFFQENGGLSSARNKGIEKSSGLYLVFLDADDWLQPDALEQHFAVIKDKPALAFVSGNYYFLQAAKNIVEPIAVNVSEDHYEALLESNYIGMHGAVMFHRWVFDHIRYDQTLRACEDYDLYLTVARQYPVLHHSKFIATYYFHSLSMSHKYSIMTESIEQVIKKQKAYINTPAQAVAYEKGLAQAKDYYRLLNFH